ncbi:DUF3644 domain-containing protein [Streptomyces sp.]
MILLLGMPVRKAWHYLLHAEFHKDKIDYHYKDPKTGQYVLIDGEPKARDLEWCLKQRYTNSADPVRLNAELQWPSRSPGLPASVRPGPAPPSVLTDSPRHIGLKLSARSSVEQASRAGLDPRNGMNTVALMSGDRSSCRATRIGAGGACKTATHLVREKPTDGTAGRGSRSPPRWHGPIVHGAGYRRRRHCGGHGLPAAERGAPAVRGTGRRGHPGARCSWPKARRPRWQRNSCCAPRRRCAAKSMQSE